MNRKNFLKSGLILWSVLSFSASIEADKLKKANALMDVPGKKPVMVEVDQSSPDKITLRYKVPEAEIVALSEKYDNTQLKRVTLGNAPLISNEGEPVLPVIPAQFIVPAGKSIASINIQREGKKVLSGKHFIEFGKAPIPLTRNAKAKQSFPDAGIYSKDDAFPSQNGALVTVQYKKGVKIAFVNINPVQYYPKSGKISVFSDLVLQVDLVNEKRDNWKNTQLPVRKSQLDPVKLGIENPEALDTYENSGKIQLQNKKGGICSSDQQYSYVFITSQSIRDANTDVTVRDLIEHRISQGYTANIVTIEEIYSNYSGVDEAEQLRNFIIDAYSTWNTEYVVLGGDVDIIPYRNLYYGQYIPSDMYFQCLDGSYNSDGDLYWGEPDDGSDGTDVDLMAEVSVGRISAENPQEMANFIYKTLAYEKAAAAPWLSRSCILGEELGPQFGPGEFSYAFPLMEEIRLGSKAAGYSTEGFVSCPAFISDTLYDNFSFFWSAESLLNLLNSNNYSIINHLGHAHETYVMKLEFEHADALANSNPLFVYSQGCYPGHFPVDCMAERLTTSSRNGMFSVVFNTVYGYGYYNVSRETLDGPSQRFNRQFWDAFFSERILKLGDINTDSHEDNIWCINYDMIRYCMYETVLFGDPSTKLRGQMEGPYLTYNNKRISDQDGGNNDGFCNPGENIKMIPEIQNIGSLPSENSICSLACTDANVTILSSVSNLPPVACCGDIRQTSSAFEFQIDAQCPAPCTINFELIINSGDSTWILPIPVEIYNPGQITGNVTANIDGSPVSGANVYYSGPVSGYSTTNENGSYTLNLIEGSYSIFVSSNGFLNSETLNVSIPPAAELNFRLYRPQMAIAPAVIDQALQVDDSISIPVQISNTGDVALQVEIRTSQLSEPLIQRDPRLIEMKNDSTDNWFSKNNTNRRAVIFPKTYSPDKHFADGHLKVLYLHTMYLNPQTDNLIVGIKSIPSVRSLDVLDCRSSIPNLDYLMEYDCVLLSSNSYWSDPVLLGNTLADYVDNNRLVIVFSATFSPGGDWQIKGRFAQPDYCPISAGEFYLGCLATGFIQHEITRNVETIHSEFVVQSQSTQGKGVSLGTYQCDKLLVGAYNPDRPVVAINVFPEDGYWSGDLIQMISNCFEWGTKRWLSINPQNTEFTIAPGSTELINVLLNSQNLFGGLYTGAIAFSHNDPSTVNPFVITVNMAVDGFRSLKITPSSLHFDNVWYGNSDTAVLTLSNDGNETTTLSSITTDDTAFYYVEPVPVRVKAKQSTILRVVFKPSAINSFNATLTVNSDAEDNGNITIPLSGNAIGGPRAVVEPTALNFSFNPNDSPADKTVVLSNMGEAVLNYSISIRQKNQIKYQMTHPSEPKIRKGLIYNPRNYKHPFAENRVIVGLKRGANNFALPNILTQAGVQSVVELAKGINPVTRNKAFNLRTLFRLELSRSGRDAVLDAINMLRKDSNVEFAEPDYQVKAVRIPNDPQFNQLYGMNNNGQTGGTADADIDAVEVWDVFTGSGEEIIIGVIDTGVDYLHPDLANNMWQNPGEIPDNGIDDDGNGYIDDYYGWDFAYDDNDPMDGGGHGTHCSGIIAAKGNNGIGVCGVMWDARIMAIKFLDDDGFGYTSDAIDAVDYAIAMNVPITSNSWGGGGYSQALEEVIAQSGIFVAAAGNGYSNIDINPYYPACFELDNIISVAATDHFDNKAEFSNFGKQSVDLAAPGVDILSTTPNSQYEFYSGTSMAVPHVSGAIGLSWSYNPRLSSLEIKDAVLKAVDTVSSMQGITVTGGRLNVKKLIDITGPGWISVNPLNTDSVLPSDSREFTVTVNPEKCIAGTWKADIELSTNDPFNPKVIVNVNAEIAGCKSVYSEDENLDFGKIWVGRDTTVPITLINQCNDLVTVSGCSFDNPLFSTEMNFPVFILPFDTLLLPVTFSPTDASDDISTVALISSDADDNPSLTVNLSGKCVSPPNISLNPPYLKKSFDYGIQDTSTITITNSGGADYQFKAKSKILTNIGLSLGNIAAAELFVFCNYPDKTLIKVNPETGDPIDSIKLDDEAFIYGMAYDGEFIYYTTGYNDINVLDFNKKEPIRTITVPECRYMEAMGVTEQYIVVTDVYNETVFVIDKTTGDIVTSWYCKAVYGLACVESNNSIFVVDYDNVVYERDLITGTLLNSYIPDTYYIHSLSYSGSAEVLFALDWNYNYYAIDPQNGSVIKRYPAKYGLWSIASDECRVKAKWIELQSKEGIIPAGENFAFTSIITTRKLTSGYHFAEIALQHIPGILADISIPCTISVSETNRLHSNPSSIIFPEVWNGGIDSTVIYLVNNGNAATTVFSASSNNKIFSVASGCPVTVNPFDSIPFTIRCTPNKVGTAEGIITVRSDVTDNPVLSIPVSATTVKPPKISISPRSISLTTLPDLQSYHSIELKNSGGADYPFKVFSITDATNNPSAIKLYAISADCLVKLDPINGERIDTILAFTDASSIAFDGEYIYLAYSWGSYIDVIDPDKKYTVRSIYFPVYGIYGLAVTEDKLIGKGNDGTYYVINKSSGEILHSFVCSSYDSDFTYCCHRNSIFIFKDPSIEERSIEDGSLINSFGSYDYLRGIAYSSSARMLMAYDGYSIYYLDPQNGNFLGSVNTFFVLALASDEVNVREWIRPMVKTGVVPKDGSVSVSVKINSTEMLPETYSANLIFEHPQGKVPGPFVVNCKLKVKSLKKLAANPENVYFGSVPVGSSRKEAISLENIGNDTITIKKITSSSKEISIIAQSVPFKIPPYSATKIFPVYTPSSRGIDAALITIKSNASNASNLLLNAYGTGVNPPVISINPQIFRDTLESGMTGRNSITISNTGELEYEFSVFTIEDRNIPTRFGSGEPSDARLFVASDSVIYSMDPVSGQISDNGIAIPGYIRGLASDPEYLYASTDVTSGSLIYVIDLDSAAVVRTISLTNRSLLGLGVGYDIILGYDQRNSEVFICNKENGEMINSWPLPFYTFALTYSESRKSVFVPDYSYKTIQERDITDGSVINEISGSYWITDCAFSERAGLLFAANDQGTVYVLEPEYGYIYNIFYTNLAISSIAADEGFSEIKWLKPYSGWGFVFPGESYTIDLGLSAEKLSEGIYSGSLVINPKRYGPGPLIVPCSLFVQMPSSVSR